MPQYTVRDSQGTRLTISGPREPNQEDIRKVFETYYSDPERYQSMVAGGDEELDRSKLGQAAETLKAIPRGMLNSLATSAEGIAEFADAATNFVGLDNLIDSGDDNELVRLARNGRDMVNRAIGPNEAYRDTWATKFGEGLGSFATFLTPGVAAKLLGAAGKTEKIARLGGAGALGASMGAGEQAQRVQAARDYGLDVSEGQEDAAIVAGSLVGLSELAPVERVLGRISKAGGREFTDTIKQRLVRGIRGAMVSGSFEGIQEVTAAIMQDAIERGLYNENLPRNESLMDDFTVGGAVGFTADLVLSAVAGRRANMTTQAQIEQELENREREQEYIQSGEEALSRAAQDRSRGLEFEAAEAIKRAEETYIDPSTVNRNEGEPINQYARRLAVTEGENFPLTGSFTVEQGENVEQTRRRRGNRQSQYLEPTFVVKDSNGQQHGQPLQTFEEAALLAGNLNDQVLNQSIRNGVLTAMEVAPQSYGEDTTRTLMIYGNRAMHPDANTITSAALNSAAETTLADGFREDLTAEQQIRRATNVAQLEREMTAAQKVNRRRLAQGLPETDTFTMREARWALGKDFSRLASSEIYSPIETEMYRPAKSRRGNPIIYSSAGEVITTRPSTPQERMQMNKPRRYVRLKTDAEAAARAEQLNARRGTNKVDESVFANGIGDREISRLLEAKNIASNINSPEVKTLMRSITGRKDLSKMTPADKAIFYQRLRTLPRFNRSTVLPDFTAKPFNRIQFRQAVATAEKTGKYNDELLARATGIDLDQTGAKAKIEAMRQEMVKQGVIRNGKVPKAKLTKDAPLTLPAPEDTLTTLEQELNDVMDKRGLGDVRANLAYALRHVSRDANGNLIYGVRKRQEGDENLQPFDPNGRFVSDDVASNVEGFYSQSINQIFLAADRVKGFDGMTPEQRANALSEILDHETIHAMRQMDLFTKKEWELLEYESIHRKVPGQNYSYQAWAREFYPDLNRVNQTEEAIAEMLRDGIQKVNETNAETKGVIRKIMDFFERLASLLNNTGFQNFNDVVSRVESGQVGSRERGEVRTLRATEAMGNLSGMLPSRQVFAGEAPPIRATGPAPEPASQRGRVADFVDAGPQPIPQSEAEAVRDRNRAAAENAHSYMLPRVNYRASPEAQYVAENPQWAATPDPDIRDKFSRSSPPQYNPGVQGAIDKLVDVGAIPDKTMGETILESVELPPIRTFLKRLRQGAVNKFARLEELNRDPKLKGHLADTSSIAAALFADRSRGIVSAALKNGAVTYEGGITKVVDFEHNGKQYRGLMDIFSPLYNNDYDSSLEELAMAYAIVKRGKRINNEGKVSPLPKGAEGRAIETSIEQEVDKYVDENGRSIIRDWHDAWQAYNNYTITFLENTGVLDDQTAQLWRDYSDYYPFYREAEGETVNKRFSVFGGMTATKDFKKVGKGGAPITMPMLDAVTKNLAAAIDMGMKNVAQQRITRDAIQLGIARELRPREKAKNFPTVEFKVDGKKRRFVINDPLLYESMQPMAGGEMVEILNKVFGPPSALLREMVTRAPGFIGVNMMRDTLSAFVTSGSNFIPVVDTVRGFADGFDELQQFGVVGGYDHSNDPKNIGTFIQNEMARRAGTNTGNNPILKPFTYMWEALGHATTMSDASTRKAVYDDVLARTGNEAEAAFQAMEIINFSRRGSSPIMRVLTTAIPFLNARIQGLDVFARAYNGSYSARRDFSQGQIRANTIARSGLLMGATALYYMLVSDDDQYKQQSDEVRDNNFIIPTESGVPYKIPIPFEVGVLFKLIPERIMDNMLGDTSDRELRESIQRAMVATFEMNPLGAQAVAPVVEAALNHNFYTGREIVPNYIDQSVTKGLQDTFGTTELAKFIGQQLNISPLKVDHIMYGYLGTLGAYALDLVDIGARTFGDPDMTDDLPARKIQDYPVLRRFFASEVGRGLQQDFYDLYDEVNTVVTTMNKLKKEGRIDELENYIVSRQVLLSLREQVNFLSQEMSEYRKQRSLVERSNMPGDLKREMIDQLDRRANMILAVVPELKEVADLPAFERTFN